MYERKQGILIPYELYIYIFTYVVLNKQCRLEKVNLKHKSGRAKVFGAVVSVGGALLLTLYKGIPLRDIPAPLEDPKTSGTKRWGTGTLLLTGGSIMWSSWFLIQAKIGKNYPCQYSSTAIISFFSTIQSAILYIAIHRNISAWLIKGNLEILTVLFSVSRTVFWKFFAWNIWIK